MEPGLMGGIALVVLLAILIPFGLTRMNRKSAALLAQLKQKAGSAEVLVEDDRAIFYGLLSKGALQPRELRSVVLITSAGLTLETLDYGLGSQVSVDVPFERVREMRVQTNFAAMAKRIIGGMLVVAYEDEGGAAEEVAIRLTDRAAVTAAIASHSRAHVPAD